MPQGAGVIGEAPQSVFYLDDLGSAFSEIDLPNKSLILRVYRTKEEASHAKDVLGIFFGVKALVASDKLSDVMRSARTSEEHVRVVLCEYDALGEMVETEVLLDPHKSIN
jgi:hypothetical protein